MNIWKLGQKFISNHNIVSIYSHIHLLNDEYSNYSTTNRTVGAVSINSKYDMQ